MESVALLAKEGWEIREKNFPSTITFSYPAKTQSVSVTGEHCRLNCGHCGGHYLKHMKDIKNVTACEQRQPKSFLISGGCMPDGKVPIVEHMQQLVALKKGRRFNVHVGLVEEDDIAGLCKIADKISFDFVGDSETIQEVFGMERTVNDYILSYKRLQKRCSVIPHICIGLHKGRIKGEYQALELLQELGTEALTFIIFTPTKNTRYADCPPPPIEKVLDILVTARKKFPAIPINLGCMRPGGNYRRELDLWSVQGGINGIVNPVSDAVRLAVSLGLLPVNREECCVL